MKILGNRVLVSRIEKDKSDGFESVDVVDNFQYMGKVEQVGGQTGTVWTGQAFEDPLLKEGAIVYFAKYSPHTHDLEDMKVIRMEDIIAIK